ncbi:hypothetical protein MSLAZ_0122 [Methanosarcina lacustris Z-7289]|uniref:Uncharacterized protein n=1 Tax=Methanosarcina lacustris Z-7289 TaxID=1434111 RepID=A0A0E3S3R7_9EURY|nr:hypothetical protein [Methanosarcina lacustris]AKB73383.1 hypothetical protein MSLAZ_0122 [Methanosarcina lacustris Z-7289]
MKLYPLLLASLLLATFFIPALLADPCSAAFIPGNNITVERNGMTWNYDEKITDTEAIFFRNLIDKDTGNNDGFVNAWEILKMEVLLGDKMEKSIEEKSDVKLNATSDPVEIKDVEFWISKDALGRTEKSSAITNGASVTYSFKEEVSPGTDIWLMGTPNSSVTITLPLGLDAEVTEGLDNKSLVFENNRTLLRGNFCPEKNITLSLSENESLKAELLAMELNRDKSAETKSVNESGAGENEAPTAGEKAEVSQSSGVFKYLLNKINQSLNGA